MGSKDPQITVALITAISAIAVAVVTTLGVIFSARKTKGYAKQAADNTEAVSNGFAASVQSKLQLLLGNDQNTQAAINNVHTAVNSLEGRVTNLEMNYRQERIY